MPAHRASWPSPTPRRTAASSPRRSFQRNLPRGMDRAIGVPGGGDQPPARPRCRGLETATSTGCLRGPCRGRALGQGEHPARAVPGGHRRAAGRPCRRPPWRGGRQLVEHARSRERRPTPPAGIYARARAAGTTAWGPLEPIATTGTGGLRPGVNLAARRRPGLRPGRDAVERRAGVRHPRSAAPSPRQVPARYSVRANPDG